MDQEFNGMLSLKAILLSLLVIVICFIILRFIKQYLIKKVAYTTKDEKHKNTLIGVAFNILQYIVVLITILVVLKINGLDVTTIVAGLGIVATIVGLALQDTLKDIISGVNIYTNNFYKVGDYVMYDGMKCEVKYFSARVTKFKTPNGDSITICNSNINSIRKVKTKNSIVLSFPFDTPQEKVNKAFDATCKKANDIRGINSAVNVGLIQISDKGCDYLISFDLLPKSGANVSDVHKILYEELRKNKIKPVVDNKYIPKENKK